MARSNSPIRQKMVFHLRRVRRRANWPRHRWRSSRFQSRTTRPGIGWRGLQGFRIERCWLLRQAISIMNRWRITGPHRSARVHTGPPSFSLVDEIHQKSVKSVTFRRRYSSWANLGYAFFDGFCATEDTFKKRYVRQKT